MNTLTVKKLSANLGPKWTVSNINLSLHSGQCAFVIGGNGSGKSTALRALAGLYPHNKGELEFTINKEHIKKSEWRDHVSFLPENFYLPPKHKIRDTLTLFLRLRGVSRFKTNDMMEEYFKRWKLSQYLDVNTNQCSLGILQQIKIALILMYPAALIILDEPMESLDPRAQALVWKQLKETIDEGSMVIVSLFEGWSDTVIPDQTLRFKGGKASTFDEWRKALLEYEKDLDHS